MAKKNKQEILQECDTQFDSLFTSFGKLLYENIQAGGISFYFDPPDAVLTARAKRYIRDIVVQKISDKKVKPMPQKTVPKVVPKAVPKVVAVPVLKPKKNQVTAIFNGAKNVIMGKRKENKPASLGIDRRGQLESYTHLVVDLHVFAKKLSLVQKDFNQCIIKDLLSSPGEQISSYQSAVDEKIREIILLMAKKQEVIKTIMEKKRQFFAEHTGAKMWKPEEDFLKQVQQDAVETTQRIDGLISEVVDLFKNIKELYDHDLEQHRLVQEQEKLRQDLVSTFPDSSVSSEIDLPVLENTPEEIPESLAVLESISKSVPEESEQPELLEPPEHLEQPEQPDEQVIMVPIAEQQIDQITEQEPIRPTEEILEEVEDYGLFETAARKLGSEVVDKDQKLEILHMLFRNSPKKVVPFLYEFVRDADIFPKRQLLFLLNMLDYPAMVGVYRRFVTDENSSMRLQGVMGLVKLDSIESKQVIATAIHDRDPHIRRFIVNHLDHRGSDPEATAIGRLAGDSDENVARIAIRKLGLMGNHFAFVSLVPKLESPNIKIRKEVISALKVLTGTDLGYNYAATDSELKRHVQPWKTLAKESYMHPRLLRDLKLKHLPAPGTPRLQTVISKEPKKTSVTSQRSVVAKKKTPVVAPKKIFAPAKSSQRMAVVVNKKTVKKNKR
ncbi:MAG: HEAT repeat domain-containing protein [Candidatus Omnitrophica bacterium]|nr:HEAT repeat domain-containing protein [Candidatus Omnitrophota bacterium]